MDKKKILTAAGSAAAVLALLAAGGASPTDALSLTWGAARHAALLTAGIKLPNNTAIFPEHPDIFSEEADTQLPDIPEPLQTSGCTEAAELQPTLEETELTAAETAELPSLPDLSPQTEPQSAQVISRNITEFDDGIDRTAAGTNSGPIYRRHYGGYVGDDYIDLPGGGVVWNCTSDSAEKLSGAAGALPDIVITPDSQEPQVLIIHTHTTESYEPYQRSYYDADYPFRTRDPDCNMTRVGEALAEKLAEHGISVLHDGTIHDYPAYTGAYDRSEVTIRAALEEYPSIKVIIDLHRDAISSADGSRTAPVAEINGRNAAQFMIITGCDDGRFGNMPDYLENFRLACLIQGSAETLYPGLARPILFDYRNYNQHISTGSLLIEVGSHANSLDEAVYSGELLGDCMADALLKLSDQSDLSEQD